MTALTFTALAAFAIGFLLGDRRGIKQANAILDGNQRALFSAIRDERFGETEPNQPLLH